MKKFRPEQKTIFYYAGTTDHPVVFVKQRIGKTLPCIKKIKSYPSEENKKILIICPFNAFQDWKDELSEEKQFSVCALDMKNKQKKIEFLYDDYQWTILNFQSVVPLGNDLRKIKWGTIVIDEGHNIKNPQAKLTKFLMKNFRDVPHRWILTGTPDPENAMNFFSQLYWADPKILNYSNWFIWRMENFKVGFNDWTMKKDYKTEFAKRLSNTCLFMSRKDIGKEPKWNTQKIHSVMPDDLREAYNTLEEEFLIEYKETFKATLHTMPRHRWLREMSSGWVNNKVVSRHKINSLMKFLFELAQKNDRPVIIWSPLIKELKYLEKELFIFDDVIKLVYGETPKDEQDKIYRDFKAGKIKYLLGNPFVWQNSKNLSNAWGMIYFSLPESQTVYSQSKDRCVDTQRMNTQNLYICECADSMDGHVYASLMNKTSRSSMNKRIIQRMKDAKKKK